MACLTIQGQTEGIVTYEKIIDYGLKPMGKPRWDNYIKQLPQKGTFVFSLYFDSSQSLFEENLDQRPEADPKLQRALKAIPSFPPPQVKELQVYHDLEKDETWTQVEFMTRNFVVNDQMAQPEWKILSRQKKVLDYVCMGAEMNTKEGNVTAWFTPQIPVSVGSDHFHGLPGLILGIEKEGDMIILATQVNLNDSGSIEMPSKGQKMDREDFDQLVKEKTIEWKQMGAAKGAKKGRGGE